MDVLIKSLDVGLPSFQDLLSLFAFCVCRVQKRSCLASSKAIDNIVRLCERIREKKA